MQFEIVDYVSGKRIPGARVEVYRTWTRLPVESIPLLQIKPWSGRTNVADEGIAYVIEDLAFAAKRLYLRLESQLYKEQHPDSIRAALAHDWRSFWKDYGTVTGQGWSGGYVGSTAFSFIGSDFNNVESNYAGKLKCNQIAGVLNSILESRVACTRFVCTSTGANSYELGTGINLDPIFQ